MIHEISYTEQFNGVPYEEQLELNNQDWMIINNELLQLDNQIPE